MNIILENDNRDQALRDLAQAKSRILEIWGINAEKYAKALCPVGTPESTGKKGYRGGTLRNSITHSVDDAESTMSVGTNVEYAPYVELGTGPYFEPPPEWESFDAPRGSGVGTGFVRPRPYLRPAITDHTDEYESIAKQELGG